ncbi:hypothetical protein [Ornithinibacillus bavariensis]|uniref:Uncharacterized protein n=1 Tax=Ornithinibacillus bavariensis TaxID=545502 RepID=A0A919X7W2_9BACI|nr:hypothetical protein [Ornithinibacillus bavariensis]GIO25743.1 hypothetical protein J43TS3_03540 [Ornithinibacillus bavariensis]
MEVLVYNCFHWIGFHYVNFLLEQGVEVVGMDNIDTDKKENLAMFLGRNSLFHLMNPQSSLTIPIAIIIGNNPLPNHITVDKVIRITNNIQSLREQENTVTISTPILYGEWMDMTEEGVILDNRTVPFNSEEFRSTAIHVKEFIQATLPLLEKTSSQAMIKVFSRNVFLDDAVKLENSLYIRDNIPIEKRMKKIFEHYERYKDLY